MLANLTDGIKRVFCLKFEDVILDCCMYLLDKSVNYQSRGDPVHIVRHISAVVSSGFALTIYRSVFFSHRRGDPSFSHNRGDPWFFLTVEEILFFLTVKDIHFFLTVEEIHVFYEPVIIKAHH